MATLDPRDISVLDPQKVYQVIAEETLSDLAAALRQATQAHGCGRCGACRHWLPPVEDEDGACKRIAWLSCFDPPDGPAWLTDYEDYDATLWCTEDFGCVLWEEKE